MIEACFDIQGTLVRVVTDVEEAVPLFGLGRYGSAVVPSRPAHFRLVYRDRRRASLRWDGRGELTFEGPWTLIRPSPVLEVLGNLALRRALEECGRFVLHASAVSRAGMAVVLFGGAGAGKTITAIALCRDHGFGLLSNGSALLGLDGSGHPEVLGTLKPGVKLRYSSFSRSFPAEADRLFAGVAGSGPGFDAKRTVAAADLGLEVAAAPQPLVAFYHLRLLSGPARTGSLDPVRLRVGLYESLARHARGAATFIIFGEGHRRSVYVPGLDSPKLHDDRRRLIEAMVTQLEGEYLAGSPSACAAHIAACAAHMAACATHMAGFRGLQRGGLAEGGGSP
jgi:hypothetical protein